MEELLLQKAAVETDEGLMDRACTTREETVNNFTKLEGRRPRATLHDAAEICRKDEEESMDSRSESVVCVEYPLVYG